MPVYNMGSNKAPWYDNRDYIRQVVIKDGVTNIGGYTFIDCRHILMVTIPNSVTSIGDWAFDSCSGLTSITIPNSVTSIGDNAFSSCHNLTSITIPNSVTSIGGTAFTHCTGLTSIEISNSVTSIGDFAFDNCSGLTSITVEKGNTKYDSRDNCNAIIETNSNKLILGCKNTVIPNSITSIGEHAFAFCEDLTSIEIPNSVTSIGDKAFANCLRLTSIDIPNSVTSIGDWAFNRCEGLSSITFKGSTPPEFVDDVFHKINNSIPVYVPANSIEAYKSVLGGWGLSDIKALPLIYLKDGEAYTQDSQIDGMEIYYTRKFSTNWEALYLPFSLKYEDWKDDFEIAYISSVRQKDNNDDGTIDETKLEFVKLKGGSTAPNTPYIIRAKSSGEKTLSVQNTTLYKAEKNSVECSTTTAKFTFTGTYKPISALQLITHGYYVVNGSMLRITPTSLKPYHWYLTISSRNSGYAKYNAAKDITISVLGEDEATGISQMQMENRQSSVYDINGRKINENSLKPGMYVKNGKKFVVK